VKLPIVLLALVLCELKSDDAKKLAALPSVQSVNVKLAVPGAKTTIIQICDWHLIGAEAFLAQYDGQLDPDEAVKLYEKHLNEVESVQKEQLALLRAILDKFKVKAVFQENLTAEQVKPYKLLADVLAKHENERDYREAILRHGATGRLYREGKIKEVLPLEDQAAWQNANPVKDGTAGQDVVGRTLTLSPSWIGSRGLLPTGNS
jgi:hypothetical protein